MLVIASIVAAAGAARGDGKYHAVPGATAHLQLQIGDAPKDEIEVPAGGKVEVALDVFCVDDHRDAPTSETAFTLARHRMPAALARTIDRETRAAAESAGGFGSADAAEPVQQQVWKARDERWVELDGEGAQETAKARGHDRHPVDREIEERIADRE